MKLSTAVVVFLTVMKILCVIPFNLNFKTMKVKSSKKSIIYSVVFPATNCNRSIFRENISQKMVRTSQS